MTTLRWSSDPIPTWNNNPRGGRNQMALLWTIGHEWEKMGGEETWRPLFRNDVKAIAGWFGT